MTPIHRTRTARRIRRRLEILRATHRWRPATTTLAASGNVIHVDPRDARGWEIVRGLGRGHQPALIDLWRRAVVAQEPLLAVDVGANYGEMVLSGSYGPSCTVLAVEPNPGVAALLRKSLSVHPDRDRIELLECLLSDEDGGTTVLHIDPRWSGSASASPHGDRPIEVTVGVRTLDSITADRPAADRLLLKIDAEGWEAQVLGGMAAALDAAASLVAIIEFDPDHLRRAGTDPGSLFERLAGLGPGWSVAYDGALAPCGAPPTEPTDLLIVSDPEVARRLGVPLP